MIDAQNNFTAICPCVTATHGFLDWPSLVNVGDIEINRCLIFEDVARKRDDLADALE